MRKGKGLQHFRTPACSTQSIGKCTQLNEWAASHTRAHQDRLSELGSVDCNGINYKRLRSMKFKEHLKGGFGFGCLRRRGGGVSEATNGNGNLEAAVVFDMCV